jgi:hypothetical protein
MNRSQFIRVRFQTGEKNHQWPAETPAATKSGRFLGRGAADIFGKTTPLNSWCHLLENASLCQEQGSSELPQYALQLSSRQSSTRGVRPREFHKDLLHGFQSRRILRMLGRYPVHRKNLPGRFKLFPRDQIQRIRVPELGFFGSSGSFRRWSFRSGASRGRLRLGGTRRHLRSRLLFLLREAMIVIAEALESALFRVVFVETLALAAVVALFSGLSGHNSGRETCDTCQRDQNGNCGSKLEAASPEPDDLKSSYQLHG